MIGDTFSVGLGTSIALEGSTLVDQISPPSRTLRATMVCRGRAGVPPT